MLLLVPFSSIVKAVDYTEPEDILPFYYRFSLVNQNYEYKFSTESHNHIGAISYGPFNSGAIEPQYHMWEFSSLENFNSAPSKILVEKGDGFSINLSNLYTCFNKLDSSHTLIERYRLVNGVSNYLTDINIQIFSVDGTYQNVTLSNPTFARTGDYYYSFSATVDEVPIDVYKFRVCLKFTYFPWAWPGDFTYYNIGAGTDSYSSISFKVIEEEKGLLKTIIEWLSNIKSGITELFDKVSNGFTNVVNNIIELPGKLWALIETGLKNLFVPSDEYFDDYSTLWDTLLADRFGAIYQVGGYIVDIGEVILQYATNPKSYEFLTVPVINIPVGGGETFTFGGYQVRLVVDGFEVVYTALKVITGIIATLLFINGLRKRYDEVMGVEQ